MLIDSLLTPIVESTYVKFIEFISMSPFAIGYIYKPSCLTSLKAFYVEEGFFFSSKLFKITTKLADNILRFPPFR